MSYVRRLIPPFLRHLDLWLQEHHPRLWSNAPNVPQLLYGMRPSMNECVLQLCKTE